LFALARLLAETFENRPFHTLSGMILWRIEALGYPEIALKSNFVAKIRPIDPIDQEPTICRDRGPNTLLMIDSIVTTL
jgi:hypothetical protein